MDQSTQIIFDIILGLAGTVSLFVLVAVWNRLGKLEDEAKQLHILVAGEYIKRTEVSDSLEKIYNEIKGLRDVMASGVEKRHHQE